MWPALKSIARALLFDELAFRRWFRAACLGYALSAGLFAQQLAELIAAPKLIRDIKVSAIAIGFIAGLTSIGEKNKPTTPPQA